MGLPHTSTNGMMLETLARAYTACIELEERMQGEAPELLEDMSLLRADLHALWMDTLRQASIPFTDRAHAARLAYELIQRQQPV